MSRVRNRLTLTNFRVAVLLALLAVCVHRVCFYVPQPGMDHDKIAALQQQEEGFAEGNG